MWLCLAGGLDEVFHFGVVFFAGDAFDAAADVDGVGADGLDGVGDVFDFESAGEDDGFGGFLFEGVGEGPVEGLASAAVLGSRAVKKKGIDFVVVGIGFFFFKGKAKGFDGAERVHPVAEFGKFVSVKLPNVDAHLLVETLDVGDGKVDNNGDALDEGWNTGDEFRENIGTNVAGALVVEVEADGVGAEFDGGLDVFVVGHAANFDFHAGGILTRKMRGGKVFLKKPLYDGGVTAH